LRVALVGYSGLVGSYIREMFPKADMFNSKNIHEIRGRDYELLILCTLPAEKWKANRFPDEDAEVVQTISEHITSVSSSQTLLVSTIDVFNEPNGVFEDDTPQEPALSGYGMNRLAFERFVNAKFGHVWTVRLSGLVGRGLKKNVIYDLRNGKSVEEVPINSQFQFYPLERLKNDLEKIMANDHGLLHLVAEPLTLESISQELGFTPSSFGAPSEDAPKYDVRSSKTSIWGITSNFQVSKAESMEAIRKYVRE
jgi:dTDP-4-dehydrorhamnose reductase